MKLTDVRCSISTILCHQEAVIEVFYQPNCLPKNKVLKSLPKPHDMMEGPPWMTLQIHRASIFLFVACGCCSCSDFSWEECMWKGFRGKPGSETNAQVATPCWQDPREMSEMLTPVLAGFHEDHLSLLVSHWCKTHKTKFPPFFLIPTWGSFVHCFSESRRRKGERQSLSTLSRAHSPFFKVNNSVALTHSQCCTTSTST